MLQSQENNKITDLYGKHIFCHYDIYGPENHRVVIRVIALRIENGLGGFVIGDYISRTFEEIKLLSETKLKTITSESNHMWMRLMVDKYIKPRMLNFTLEVKMISGETYGRYQIVQNICFNQ